ncbi:MAG: TIM barrel protein [Gemmatimonadota bacterium]
MMHAQVSLALPSLAGYGLWEALDLAEAMGFRALMGFLGGPRTAHSQGEFPTFGYYDGDAVHGDRVRRRLAAFARRSIHQSWDEDWERWVEGAAFLGAEILTVHARGRGADEGPAAHRASEGDRLRRIGDAAGARGLRVGVENAGGRADEYLPLVRDLGHEQVGATLDLGHCAYFAEVQGIADLDERVAALNQTIADLVAGLGSRLFHFHAHNVRREDWRDHRSAPEGVIDMARLFDPLRRQGFGGLFDIELEEPERETKARETGEYLSRLLRG